MVSDTTQTLDDNVCRPPSRGVGATCGWGCNSLFSHHTPIQTLGANVCRAPSNYGLLLIGFSLLSTLLLGGKKQWNVN